LFRHVIASKLTISYHATVIHSMERGLHSSDYKLVVRLQQHNGERHENLSSDDADR
jgi:hypothetical protein